MKKSIFILFVEILHCCQFWIELKLSSSPEFYREVEKFCLEQLGVLFELTLFLSALYSSFSSPCHSELQPRIINTKIFNLFY